MSSKGIWSEERFNLEQNLRKNFDQLKNDQNMTKKMTNYFAPFHYYSNKYPFVVKHLFGAALIGSGCLIE